MTRLAPAPAPPGTRRRRRGEAPTRKASFTLHADVIEAVKAAVGEGAAPNSSAFVEAAVREKLQRAQRAQLYAAYAEAAQDPAFLADMRAVGAAFDRTAADGLTPGGE